ncbi:MAG: GGDEF domain-containing protein, partial [Acidimicrobiia bacterium]
HDPLTGLANRSLLLEQLRDALSRLATSDRGGLALLYCDLDGFKRINDEHGHDVGDRTLIDIANRIRSQLRPGDMVGRIGGDEFVALCQRIEDPNRAKDVAIRIRTAVVNRPPPGLTERLDVSIGVAWTNQNCDADALLHEADRQMYRSKRAHGSSARAARNSLGSRPSLAPTESREDAGSAAD